ncbi:MAG: dephospho-CoA kinase [Rhizobiales bacterium]|nr:dephospho-CoA kinase [Hyphomicrobiales bacterium]
MRVIGLTGSAAMGKSTVAKMFAEAGMPVFDADATVHELYAGEAAPLIETAFPGTASDGAVDRVALRGRVLGDDAAMKQLEAIVHPLVRAREMAFRDAAAKAGARAIVLDIPLLMETGGEARIDAVVVVSAPADVQRARLRGRGLDEAAIDRLLARQMPDAEKRRRAHFVIDTGTSLEATRRAVGDLMRAIAGA